MTFGTITSFTESATVRFVRRIPAPVESVWQALADDAALSGWLAPATLEAKIGGRVHIEFGTDQTVDGEVTEFEPSRALEYTWTFTGEPDSVLRFELISEDGGTTLILEHRLLPPDQAAGYGAGWHAHLDVLGANLVGGEPVDWEERFSRLRRSVSRIET